MAAPDGPWRKSRFYRSPPPRCLEQEGRWGYVAFWVDESTAKNAGGRHGEGSDAKQQGKEETEARQEQEERWRCEPLAVRRHAQPIQSRRQSIRQEVLDRLERYEA